MYIVPTQQCFHTFDAVGLHIDDRLVVQHEFVPRQSLVQLLLQNQAFTQTLIDLLRVELGDLKKIGARWGLSLQLDWLFYCVHAIWFRTTNR